MKATKVHFTRDHRTPVCGAAGRNRNAAFILTSNKNEVTCGRRECQQEAGAIERHDPWRDDYQ
jgi:hypothetical protein